MTTLPAPPPELSARAKAVRWLAGLAALVVILWLSVRSWPVEQMFGGQLLLGTDAGGHTTLEMRGRAGVAWSVGIWSLAVYALVLTAIHWLRVLRMRPLFGENADLRVAELNRGGAIAFAALVLLPFRLGEFVRPALFGRKVPFAAGLGAVVVERVIDGLLVTGILFVVLFEVHPDTLARHPQVQVGAWVAAAVFGVALAGIVAMLAARDFTVATTRRLLGALSPKLAEKLIGLGLTFRDGLTALRSPGRAVGFVGLTVVYWGLNGLGIWLLARGFGLELPIIAAYAMMCCLVVGMMIPNPPGNVGFWNFLLMPAVLYGLDPDLPRHQMFALAVWFAQTAQITLFGLWGLWAEARWRRRLAVN